MINHQPPAAAKCDTSALDRNLAFAQKYRINGTPAVFFTDGTRVPGAMQAAQIEAMLAKTP
jgi:thiol:disulfide interchange protein DsbC